MKNYFIKPVDVFEIVQRQRKKILISFFITFAFVMFLFVVLPRTYQVEANIHIGVNYFQNPLITELVSQTHDPNELRAEREKIIKASLGVDFAKRMGEKYKLFKSAPNDPDRPTEIELFLKSLDISPISSTQFTIKYKAHKPDVAIGVLNDAIEAIRVYMYLGRVQMLEEFLSVLQNEITGTSDSPSRLIIAGGAKSEVAKAQINSQIKLLEARLDELLRTYNDQHPSVQAIKTQISELKSYERSGFMSPNLTKRKMFQGNGGASALGMLTIKDDLTKQRHLVNMSLEMEKKDPNMNSYVSLTKEPVFPKKPLFPKLKLFILFALVASVLVSTMTAAIFEFGGKTLVGYETASRKLNAEVFGMVRL